MKSTLRGAIFSGAALMMLSAALAPVAISGPEQEIPPPASPPSHVAQPNRLTLEQRGDVSMARKNFQDAAQYYEGALKQSPSRSAELWNKLGIAYQQENQFHSARQAYTHAARANKTFAEPWNNMGTLFFMTKRYRKSVGYFQHAIKLRSDVAVFHINLGSAYYHLKHYQQVVEEYRAALALDPKIIAPESTVGTVVHAGGTDVEYYFYMAKALASVGNAEVAVRYLRRALEDGYKDRRRIDADPDFKKISRYPAFVELMRNPPVAIKD